MFEVVGKRITIDLPERFHGKDVEITVVTNEVVPCANVKNDWKEDFLSISQWDATEEELKMKSG